MLLIIEDKEHSYCYKCGKVFIYVCSEREV